MMRLPRNFALRATNTRKNLLNHCYHQKCFSLDLGKAVVHFYVVPMAT